MLQAMANQAPKETIKYEAFHASVIAAKESFEYLHIQKLSINQYAICKRFANIIGTESAKSAFHIGTSNKLNLSPSAFIFFYF
ncbi:MAG: hypothetical protein LBQ24_05355 [Candidatus Peribacteria bacterium]|jgi:hypothetical protein|nr:hypothetical protein [Candidatus Peribacteria bacterium]